MKGPSHGAVPAILVGLSVSLLGGLNAEAAQHNVTVTLANNSQNPPRCVVTAPKSHHFNYRVRAVGNDTVIWNVTNNCGKLIRVGIGGFRPFYLGQQIDSAGVMQEASSALQVTLQPAAPGNTGSITGRIRTNIVHYGAAPEVYVYDIQEITGNPPRAEAIADPEIEIP